VAVTWASNAFGTIQPVADIARIAKERGALVLVDASQAVGAVLVDVREVQADLLAFPGHKALGGPTGTGVLWVRPGVEVVPLREGGSGGDTSSPRHPRTWPDRLEAGTLNTFGIAGLGAGVSWIRERTVEAIRAEETALIGRMLDGLRSIPGVQVFGPAGAADRVGVVSFRVPGYTAQEADAVLALSFDIAVRPGLHCAPGAHRSLGTWPDGTVRASLGPMSTANDVDVLVAAVGEMVAARIG
jgi:selenocysteine lyase/cysteine desulfurase